MASFSILLVLQLIFSFWPANFATAAPAPQASSASASAPAPASTGVPCATDYWVCNIQRQGTVAYGSNASYTIYRNVKDYGAAGDGTTDDTNAINDAIAAGDRCGEGCDSSTTTPAIVYFPPGTYSVSAPIIQYYYTQFVGDALDIPTIKATSSFQGIAVLDSDPYIPNGNGANWYTNQNNFFRQIRNFVIDITSLDPSTGACIHWQVAQATSLQNIVFNMSPSTTNNKQQGIFMDNGSGGFMTDLIFNGGQYGAFLGNQQFTSRNMTFNNCQTAIYMNWNWLWTFKSLNINNCNVGIDMSGTGGTTGGNQTVGSIVVLDSKMTGVETGILTAYDTTNSIPKTGGTLSITNVDFTGVQNAVVGAGNATVLKGGSVVPSWVQGDAYQPASGYSQKAKRQVTMTVTSSASDCPTSTQLPSNSSMPSSMPTPFPNNTIRTGYSNQTGSTCTSSAVPVSSSRVQQQLTAPTLPSVLMSGSGVFERSKPQYENLPESSFVSIKSQGAKGDGVTDDTEAIQAAMNNIGSASILYFDHGAYLVSSTINVPKNIRITGEIWPLIMADGSSSNFSDPTNPQPVWRIGNENDIGAVEISDLIFETRGAAPGAIMMEWNVQDSNSTQGGCGLWDTHFRIGGSAGTELQQNTCIGNTTDTQTFNAECAGSFLMLHITQSASAYLENVWLWAADHELDMAGHDETNIYNGRGMLVESHGPVWLYGTSSEHSQFYNYQIANAQNIFMGAIQTETPYMQSSPDALNAGFTPNAAYSDPTFANCTTESCKKTWGLRIVDSQDVYMYSGGLYSFFDDYLQECLATESCQENMVDLQCSTNVYLYGLTTKASVNMVNVNNQTGAAVGSDNTNLFGQTVVLFEQL